MPLEGEGPLIFAEIQGYNDPRIYWRAFREVAMALEARNDDPEILLVVLFLNPAFRPERCPLRFEPPSRLVTADLEECLKTIRGEAGVLTVLKPLVSNREEIGEGAREWREGLEKLAYPPHVKEKLVKLLEYAILERLPRLTREEMETMFELTPIEQTVIGRELLAQGRAEGKKEGKKEGTRVGEGRGRLIGAIQALQEATGQPVDSLSTLRRKSLKSLNAILAELKTRVHGNGQRP